MAKPKRINLALQGGGAHGAFTWGVLDRLLDDEGIEIAGISGTSAGALNGAALKSGLVADGKGQDRDAARANLDALWHSVAGVHDLRLTSWFAQFAPQNELISQAFQASPMVAWADMASRVLSPYAYGPFYMNPLHSVVEKFDFDQVCADIGPRLYVSATNVRTGKIRVFDGAEISTEAILASACLPTVFQAVEMKDPKTGKDEAFWDGGYSGNPALFPLFEPTLPADVVVVNINPLFRPDVPQNAADIQNRINEISFNSSLLRELRAINFVKRLISVGKLTSGQMRDVLVHMISDDVLMRDLSTATKLVPSTVMLHRLKAAGRAAAGAFLDSHRDDLNTRGTVDLEEMFS
ncbi:patatin-like phospholipase family protein [Aliiroseovarius sp. S1339]|uniref:patatin-like phospholipase family protein n=1 Tax=Aliiroseovarius sp. S1339 TaxID=2936990 RepID=UPI0020C0556A|nr:patatin-like phospholipase family protein [Aliiroseovarius sp. S1339]MCK8462299.1 patatin-like phospholipase family protein [Aliiroseovarius sp. S1339]